MQRERYESLGLGLWLIAAPAAAAGGRSRLVGSGPLSQPSARHRHPTVEAADVPVRLP